MRYAYDGWQRVSSVRSPYDTGSVPAVSYSYGIDGAGRWYAVTGNKVSLNPGDTSVIQTVIQADGLGRASRTAKTGVVHDRGADTKRTGWNVAGAVEYDAEGNDITAEYDLLGRKLSLASVDGGRREYKYDAYRLTEETSPNLRAKGKWIGYEYDGLGRLVRVDYPETADTLYTYGAPGAADNAAGKITNLTDASGTVKYKYGKLGETTEETRTLSVRNGKAGEMMTATTGYLSNYLGQMDRISYPDGETVDYGYDAGGQVERVTGHHYGHDYLFVLDIGYDELGQRSYISYGNGVRTDYDYDPDRRWLSSIETRRDGRQYQNISYSFDRVGNVLGYVNDCMDGLRYSVSQTYGYDDLYQLTSAHGETTNDPFKGGIPDYRSTYDQSYSFDVIGNMTRKTSGSSVYPQKTIGSYLDYDFDYGYAAGFAHRLDHAGGRYYRYDLDGNITMEHHGPIPEGLLGGSSGGTGSTGGDDDGFWDDPAGNGQYNGSWDGDMAGDGTGSDDDFWDDWDEDSEYSGSWTGNSGSGTGSDDDFWDDMDGNGQYTGSWDGDMAGDGTGSDDGFWDDLGGNGQYTGSWDGEMAGGSGTGAQQDSSILAVYEWDERDRLVRSQTPGVTAYYVYGEDGQRTNKHTSDSETLYFSRLWTWHDGKGAGDQTSKHIYLGSERIVTQMNGWKGQQTYSEELNKTYYYHPDHLGSAQLITDNKGQEYQRIEYTVKPYGLTMSFHCCKFTPCFIIFYTILFCIIKYCITTIYNQNHIQIVAFSAISFYNLSYIFVGDLLATAGGQYERKSKGTAGQAVPGHLSQRGAEMGVTAPDFKRRQETGQGTVQACRNMPLQEGGSAPFRRLGYKGGRGWKDYPGLVCKKLCKAPCESESNDISHSPHREIRERGDYTNRTGDLQMDRGLPVLPAVLQKAGRKSPLPVQRGNIHEARPCYFPQGRRRGNHKPGSVRHGRFCKSA